MTFDARLLEQNSWWRTPGAIAEDPHLIQLGKSLFHWSPPALSDIPLRLGDLDTLRGPRQVGKTTTVKQMIGRLIDRGERRVLYYSFDLERDNSAISDVIRRAKTLSAFPPGPWYLFLDEVTSISDWQLGVKYAWDSGLTREDYVLCTGSSARRMGTEQLPGRRGAGRNYLQLPLSFGDFCRSVRRIELPAEAMSIAELMEPRGRILLKALYPFSEPLLTALAAYQQVGGLPAAVGDYLSAGTVARNTFAIVWATLAHEIAQARLDTTAALKLIERIGVSLGSSLSWQSAADAMGVGSHNTAHQYAVALAESFSVLMVYHWSVGGGFEPRKQRKLYFLDPLLGRLPAALAPGSRLPNEDGVTEGLVAAALFRSSSDHVTQSEPLPGAFGYWRSTQSREIDFVVPVHPGVEGRIPIEVKGDGATDVAGAVSSIRRSFGRGIVATRTLFEPDGDIPRIPVPILLAALRERSERGSSTI